jgi:hypothetical protein
MANPLTEKAMGACGRLGSFFALRTHVYARAGAHVRGLKTSSLSSHPPKFLLIPLTLFIFRSGRTVDAVFLILPIVFNPPVAANAGENS